MKYSFFSQVFYISCTDVGLEKSHILRVVKQYRDDVEPILTYYTVHKKLTTLDSSQVF